MFVIVFQTFVDLHRAFSLKRQTVVTCISTLKKSHDEEKAVSCLILGTESSMIYILDPEAFTILDTLIVPAPPSHLAITGLYDVDYRIVAACRNGTLCNIKRGWNEAKVIALLESQVCIFIIYYQHQKKCKYLYVQFDQRGFYTKLLRWN